MNELLKATGVKKYIKTSGLRVGKDALAQLERKLSMTLTSAVQSAKNDRRTTVRAEDFN